MMVCCTKQQAPEGRQIVFSVSGEFDADVTKAAITSSDPGTIYVHAERNNTGVANLSPAAITRQSGGFWRPSASVLWQDGGEYVFNAYGYTSGISDVASNGLSFTVAQPSVYNPSNMADFVSAPTVEVSSEKSYKHPLIALDFHHVLPAVQIYVTKVSTMSGNDVVVTDMSLSGLFYGAKMAYDKTGDAWLTTGYTTDRLLTYSNSGSFSVSTDKNSTEAVMDVISVPQGLSADAVLSITYQVDEDGTPKNYTQTFHLSEYLERLNCGHRTVLHASIDTGIHLTASIAPWKKVDFIEGTILPAID